MRIDDLDTPAVVIDTAVVRANLTRAQGYATRHGLAIRPHIKTHKLPLWAKRQVELGAVGITCQKIGEAEVMADAGLTDIFIPYNILGAAKLERLAALHARTVLSVTGDSMTTIDGYAARFTDPANPLPVLVELDTGGKRCGVGSIDEVLLLARRIDAAPGLTFGGIMTFPPRRAMEKVNVRLGEVRDALVAIGLPPRRITTGGSPDFDHAHEITNATEHRPGTYIYHDRMQVAAGRGSLGDCALTVLATVVSRSAPDRAVLDAGSKALAMDMSGDPAGHPGHGHIVEYPEAVITSLSEEHGMVDVSACKEPPNVGDRVRVVPNHVCVVSNLFDEVHLVVGDDLVEAIPVVARGKLG